MADSADNSRKIDPERLKRLGFDDDLIKEAVEWEKRGLLDVQPPSDLVERVMERVKKRLEPAPKP
jgi:hypothetical protein